MEKRLDLLACLPSFSLNQSYELVHISMDLGQIIIGDLTILFFNGSGQSIPLSCEFLFRRHLNILQVRESV